MIQYTIVDSAAILRLASPPVNALNIPLLEALLESVHRAAADPRVRAIVITGGPEQFSAGADLDAFRRIRSADEAIHLSRTFQQAFQEVEDARTPVVAALAGHVLGSGLELALACHLRVAAHGSRFSLPEVRLGINPGAGGTQRLPRLVGLDAALEMLLTGQAIDAERALALGLVSELCAPDELVSCAARVGSQPGPKTRERRDRIDDAVANRAAFDQADKLLAAGRPELVAPAKIVDAVKVGIHESFEAGLRREQLAFAECMATRATQNKIYLFFATRQAGKVPGLRDPQRAEAPDGARIERAGVLGMGTMGAGIAQALIASGIAVTGCDESQAALDRAVDRIRRSLEGRVRQGRLSAAQAQQMLGRLRTTTDLPALADAQLVVESVVENADIKRRCIAQLEEWCRPETLIATNTSTLNLDQLAAHMRRPERLVGIHFFHPAQRMPLVEVIRREATPPTVTAAAVQFARRLGKTPVLVRNREGFIVNRLFLPYLKEAFWLLEEGVAPEAIDRAMVDFGFPMGPLVLIDMSGLDILLLTDAVLQAVFPWHGPLSSIVPSLVERGHLGQKTGCGVYRYEPGDHTPRRSDVAVEVIARARRGRSSAGPSDHELVDRLVLRMVAEALRVVEEGIVERPADIDVAMVLGTGLADFRGGLLRYACDVGLDRVADQLRELAGRYGPRYEPCELLRAAAADPDVLQL